MVDGRDLTTDLAAHRLDGTAARLAFRGETGEPPCEVDVAAGRLAAGLGVGGDRPHVARPAPRLTRAPTLHQAGLGQPLEVRAHAIGMQREALGELLGPRRSPQLAEHAEDAAPCRLGERVVGTNRGIHAFPQFYTGWLGKPTAMR